MFPRETRNSSLSGHTNGVVALIEKKSMQAFRISKSVTGLELFPGQEQWQTITHLLGHSNGVALFGKKSIHRLFFQKALTPFV